MLIATTPHLGYTSLSVPEGLAWYQPFFRAPFDLYISKHSDQRAKDVGKLVADHYADADASKVTLTPLGPADGDKKAEYEKGTWGWLLFLTPGMFNCTTPGESELAKEVLAALKKGITPVVVYDADQYAFRTFFEETPQALIDEGLFGRLAVEWREYGDRREASALRVSVHLVASALGAKLDQCACLPRGPRETSGRLAEGMTRKMRAMTAVFDHSGRDARRPEEHPNNTLLGAEMQAPQTQSQTTGAAAETGVDAA